MRLLNVHTLKFREFESDTPKYAVASHRWQAGQEAKIGDVRNKRNRTKSGYKKVEGFAEYIREYIRHIEWLWIDTCCVNQDSSQEVTEAVNSMFRWYANAEVCLVYLVDVNDAHSEQEFRRSEWFTRGWTLQELLAPHVVLFLSHYWDVIGHKGGGGWTKSAFRVSAGPSLEPIIASATGIPEAVLHSYNRSKSFSIEERLAWINGRKTTRDEDMSYSLLGIFNITMPVIYGEGAERARSRFFEELSKASTFLYGNYGNQNIRRTISLNSEGIRINTSFSDLIPTPFVALERFPHYTPQDYHPQPAVSGVSGRRSYNPYDQHQQSRGQVSEDETLIHQVEAEEHQREYSPSETSERSHDQAIPSSSGGQQRQSVPLQAQKIGDFLAKLDHTSSADGTPKVPEGWAALWNNQHLEWFYINTHTKLCQWDKPTEPVYPGLADASSFRAVPEYDHNTLINTALHTPDITRLAREPQAQEDQRGGYGAPMGATGGCGGALVAGGGPALDLGQALHSGATLESTIDSDDGGSDHSSSGEQLSSPYFSPAYDYPSQMYPQYPPPPQEKKKGLLSRLSLKLGGPRSRYQATFGQLGAGYGPPYGDSYLRTPAPGYGQTHIQGYGGMLLGNSTDDGRNDIDEEGSDDRAQSPPLAQATALYTYTAPDAGDLELQPNDHITITEYMNTGWWKGRSTRRGQEVIFPRNYVKVINEKSAPAENQYAY